MSDTICKRSAIRALASLQRPRDADEFYFQFINAGAYNGIAVTSDIHKRKMRRDVRVSQ
jgi:hypothetical protein